MYSCCLPTVLLFICKYRTLALLFVFTRYCCRSYNGASYGFSTFADGADKQIDVGAEEVSEDDSSDAEDDTAPVRCGVNVYHSIVFDIFSVLRVYHIDLGLGCIKVYISHSTLSLVLHCCSASNL